MLMFVKLIVFIILFCTSLVAADIKAMPVLGNVSDISPSSRAWLSASYQDITLYPKYVSDRDNRPRKAKVKAIHDGQNISFLIKWKGDEISAKKDEEVLVYADGFLIQFPVEYADVNKLPYIDEGNKGRPVVIYLQKKIKTTYEAYESIDFFLRENKPLESQEKISFKEREENKRLFIAEGQENITLILDKDAENKMYMVYKNGYWRGTLSIPLKLDYLVLDRGAFPMSFAVSGRDNHKSMSSWIAVELVSKGGGDSLLKALREQAKGDIVNGEKIALENCASCHQYRGASVGSDFMAPNLSNIGGYSTKEYLRESILNPSAIIVGDKENSSWYDIVDKDTKISTMPSYGWLDKESLEDLIAFFGAQK